MHLEPEVHMSITLEAASKILYLNYTSALEYILTGFSNLKKGTALGAQDMRVFLTLVTTK
jgi:hypothetical protein